MTLATSSSANTTPNSASSSMTQRTVPRAVPLLDPSRCPSTEQALESICHFVAAHDNRTIGVVGRRWEVRVCLEELLRRAKVSFVKETHDRCVHYLIQAGSGEPLPVEHIPEIVQQHKETQACEEEHQLQQALELSRRDQQEQQQQQQQHERLSTPLTSQEELNNHALSTEAAALEYALKLSQQETEQANNHQHFERTETTNSTNTNKNNLASPATLREEAAIDYAIQLSQKQQQQQQQHEPTSTTKSTTRVSFSKTVSEKEQRQSQEAQDAELARRVAKDGSLVFQQGNEPGKSLLEVYEDPLEDHVISTNDDDDKKSNNHNSNRQDSASSAVSQDEALALRVAVEGSLVLHEQDIRKSLVDDNDDHNTANDNSNNTLPSRHTEQQQSLQSMQDSTSSAVSDDEALALRVAVEGSLVLHEQEAGKPLIEDDEQQQHDITDEALALRVAREGSWVLSAAANSHQARPGALLVPEEVAQMSSTSKDESDNAPPSFQIILCLQCRTEIQAPLVFQKISCPGCQYVNRSD